MIRLQFLACCMACLILAPTVFGTDTLSEADAARLGVLPHAEIAFQQVYRASETAPDREVREIAAANLDGRRFLFRVSLREKTNLLISDLKFQFKIPAIPGKSPTFDDLLRVSLANYAVISVSGNSEPAGEVRAVQAGSTIWFTYQLASAIEETSAPCRFAFSYRSAPESTEEKPAGPILIRLSNQSVTLPPWPEEKTTLILSDSAYRLITDRHSTSDDRVFKNILGTAYESRSNKGLHKEDIAKIAKTFHPSRKRPDLAANLSPSPGSSNQKTRISFTVPEESGRDRSGVPVTLGVPLAKGTLFSVEDISVTRADGTNVPAGISLRAKWPDGSVKWINLSFQDDFKGNQTNSYTLSTDPQKNLPLPQLKLREDGKHITLDTGIITAVLDKEKLLPLSEVRKNGDSVPVPLSASGIELSDENGEVFSTASIKPESVRIEEQSNQHCVIRYEGRYANAKGRSLMRYVARLSFQAGSGLVKLSFTHINDSLEQEFSDIQSLKWQILRPNAVLSAQAATDLVSGETKGPSTEVYQWNDQLSEINHQQSTSRIPGGFLAEFGGGKIGVAAEDFWQRYPKGFKAGAEGMTIDFLPRQPNTGFGSDLPVHLSFPFVEGLYRTKWGMAFTQNVTLDFSGERSASEMAAIAQRPSIGILPANVYADNRVFGEFPVKTEGLAGEWDKYFEGMFASHEERRERQREYGFVNYGDWYGERGRNWGNNEYDTAHAFFRQFARTGNPAYFRSALAAARHQADVDIIHAYPDPFFIGGNYIHGIAHTGTTSHRPRHGIWSQDYGLGAWGSNGHTWAEGLCEAWLMAGDHPSAEAALELGEHLRWAVAPNFEMNIPNPRYAGWAVRAATELYRTFGDSEHLTTAKLITAKSSDHQDPENGGWLYPLYGGPAGNSVYMHGIVLAGLSEYYDETSDPKALEVMKGAGNFIKQAWNKNGYWPYMVQGDGAPHPKRDPAPSVGLNFMLAEGLGYLGLKQHDAEALRIAQAATKAQLTEGPLPASGQKVGNALRSGVRLFGYLETAAEQSKPKSDAPASP